MAKKSRSCGLDPSAWCVQASNIIIQQQRLQIAYRELGTWGASRPRYLGVSFDHRPSGRAASATDIAQATPINAA